MFRRPAMSRMRMRRSCAIRSSVLPWFVRKENPGAGRAGIDEPARARPGAGAGPAMNLQPLADRLIVEVLEEEEATVSGIVLPDTAREKPQRGRVLAVGPGARDEHGKHIALDVA